MPRTKKVKETAEKPKVDKVAKPKAISPYDIIKMMFMDINGFNNVSNFLLGKNEFLINRVFAIQYPLQAHCFNRTGVQPADVVKSWCLFGQKTLGYGKIPSFVFTKSGASKKKDEVEEGLSFSKEDIAEYCSHFGMTLKDFNDLMEFDSDFMMNDVKSFIGINSNDMNKSSFVEEKNKRAKKNETV